MSETPTPRARPEAPTWRLIALGTSLIAFGSVVGTIVAVALEDKDALAELALVLAVIAFLVQIVVYAFQTTESNRAALRGERASADTRAALEEIRAKADANERILVSQFERLLEALLARQESARSEASDDEPVDEETSARAAAEAPRQAAPQWPASLLLEAMSPESLEIADRMKSWPSKEEAESLAPEVAALGTRARILLARYANNEVRQRRKGQPVGLRRNESQSEARDELRGAGMLKDISTSRCALTERGREAARLLVGEGKPAEEIVEILRASDLY